MRLFYLFLLCFLGLGAIGGGVALIASPSGEAIGMPVSVLKNSPFTDFLVPGLLLFIVFGICPFVLIIALLSKPGSRLAERFNFFSDMHWAWSFSLYQGFALLIWIQVQMTIMQAVHWLHTFYVLYAILMLFTGLLPGVRRMYRK